MIEPTAQGAEQTTSQASRHDTANWAPSVDGLRVPTMPIGALNLNVEGRHLTGPLMGFGQMWQKTYCVRLDGADVSPQQVIRAWKDNFSKFWPDGNDFYGGVSGIAPGQVAVLNLAGPGGRSAPGGGPLISTGIMVIYADDESFSFMTPQGHMFAGMITFSAADEDGGVVAQVQALIRASDPIFELMFRLGVGHPNEDAFWRGTLANLAGHFNVAEPVVTQRRELVDPKMQWGQARNIWHNAAIRTMLHLPGQLARQVLGK
jgi:hypothetical protein